MTGLRLGVILAVTIGLGGCAGASAEPLDTVDAAIAKAVVAIDQKLHLKVDPKDFRADLQGQNWLISNRGRNPPPPGFGGDIFVVLSQRDGKILRVEMPD